MHICTTCGHGQWSGDDLEGGGRTGAGSKRLMEEEDLCNSFNNKDFKNKKRK